MQIIPSILEYTEENFRNRFVSLSQLSKHLHVDIVDQSVGQPTITALQVINILDTKPTNHTYELHLMMKDPLHTIEKINSSGLAVAKIYLHIDQYALIKENNYENVCFYINPDDQVNQIGPIIPDCPSALVMTIQPGKQGNPFMPDQLIKIKQLRQSGYMGEIYIDGGINDIEAKKVAQLEYKPNGVVVGSFLNDSPDQSFLTLQNVFTQT